MLLDPSGYFKELKKDFPKELDPTNKANPNVFNKAGLSPLMVCWISVTFWFFF